MHAGKSVLTVVACALVLMVPAVVNGFPLLFPDTAAYLNVAFGHSWTLDRSGFYGLLLKPASLVDPATGLWIAVVVQVVTIAGVLVMAARALAPAATGWQIFASVFLVSALTSLPWHAAQLMPDAFTGPMILVAWLAASRPVGEPGTPMLWLLAAVMALLHYTHLLILAAAGLAALAVAIVLAKSLRPVAPRIGALTACLGLAVGAQVAANGIMFDRWTVSPMGPMFLFARLQEDGLVPHWMERHCGRDASPELCALMPAMPRDSQVVLWGRAASPLDSRINRVAGKAESWVWVDRLSRAASGAVREQPVEFARNSLRAGAKQFMRFEALDDECPSPQCRFPGLLRSLPTLREPVEGSRQFTGRLPKEIIRSVTTAGALIGLLMLAPIAEIARRKGDKNVLSLVAAVVAALIVNALVTGALSDVHDRYQSRLIWLPFFVCLIAILRWHSQVRTE